MNSEPFDIKKFKENGDLYQFLFENNVLGIGISNLDGKILLVNQAMKKIHHLNEMSEFNVGDFFVDKNKRIELLEILHEKGEVRNFEIQMTNPNRSNYWVLNSTKKITYNGQPAFFTTQIDISAKMDSETSSYESIDFYRGIFNYTSNAIAVYETKDNGENFLFVDINRIGEEMDKVKRDGLIGKNILDCFPDVKRFGLLDLFQQVWRTGKPEHHPISLYDDNRISGWRENYIFKHPNGNIIAIYSDRTKEKEAERLIIEREELFDHVLQNISVGIVLVDNETKKIFEVNQTILNMTNFNKDDLLGEDCKILGCSNVICPADCCHFLEKECIIKGKNRQIPVYKSVERIRLKNKILLIESFRDLTNLKESEAKLKLIASASADFIIMLDLDFNIQYINRGLMRNPTEIIGQSLYKLAKNPVEVKKSFETAVNLKKSQKYYAELNLDDNTILNFENIAAPILIEDKVVGLTVTCRDITEKEIMRKNLEKSERLYRSLVENNLFGVLVISEGEIKFANDYMAKIYESTIEDMMEWTMKDAFNLVHPDDRKKMHQVYRNRMDVDNLEYRIVLPSGKIKWVRHFMKYFKELEMNSMQLITFDVTEQKKMESERINNQKMESIGILAGGIAHDYNNILVGILGNIELLQMEKLSQDQSEIIQDLRQASFRARDLSKQLLTFSKGGKPIKSVINIKKIIKETASLTLRGTRCKFEITSNKEIPNTEGDISQINQVFSNLIINAVQAMPKGGLINITLSTIEVNSKKPIPVENGSYISVAIKDEGMGIPIENHSSLFSPYFTTKEKGSGLGLITCYSIIKHHGGYINFESQSGKGSIFYVYLPLIHKISKSISNGVENLVPSGLKILFMDDEESIHRIVIEFSKKIKSSAETVINGEKVLISYKKAMDEGKKFDIVIMDLTIPLGMDGKETISELLKIDPEAIAIVSSGYSNDPIMANPKEYGFKATLKKPYSFKEFRKVIAQALKESQK
jgi:PAS domain S-box-containing protein